MPHKVRAGAMAVMLAAVRERTGGRTATVSLP
jgi:hypothetical protein